jgi:hypothetical protein
MLCGCEFFTREMGAIGKYRPMPLWADGSNREEVFSASSPNTDKINKIILKSSNLKHPHDRFVVSIPIMGIFQ